MDINMQNQIPTEHHYFITPPDVKSREEAWDQIGEYLMAHTQNKWVYFRDQPYVYSELDFDTQITKHRGVVRFHTIPGPEDRTMDIPSIGEI